MPRTISRVLSETVSNNGDNSRISSRIGSRISSVSKWLSSKKGGVETTIDAAGGGSSLTTTTVTVSGPSMPHPMLHPVPSRASAIDEDALSHDEDVMPARRREIRFYDEPEPRPAESSEAALHNALPTGHGHAEAESMETRPLGVVTSESESHSHSA